MARLHRPYIPIPVRVVVAERQFRERFGSDPAKVLEPFRSAGAKLKGLLWYLFGEKTSHLDHDPALENRRKYHRRVYPKGGGASVLMVFYDPPANDPKHLIYREGGLPGDGSEHDIKTRVRGEHGQLSDHAIARKEKRRAKKKTKAKVRGKKETFRQFERRFDRGDPSTIDRQASAQFPGMTVSVAYTPARVPNRKIQSRGFPPKGSRKFRSAR